MVVLQIYTAPSTVSYSLEIIFQLAFYFLEHVGIAGSDWGWHFHRVFSPDLLPLLPHFLTSLVTSDARSAMSLRISLWVSVRPRVEAAPHGALCLPFPRAGDLPLDTPGSGYRL